MRTFRNGLLQISRGAKAYMGTKHTSMSVWAFNVTIETIVHTLKKALQRTEYNREKERITKIEKYITYRNTHESVALETTKCLSALLLFAHFVDWLCSDHLLLKLKTKITQNFLITSIVCV